MPLELFHGPEMALAHGAAGLNNFVFCAHERGQIMPLNLCSDCQ